MTALPERELLQSRPTPAPIVIFLRNYLFSCQGNPALHFLEHKSFSFYYKSYIIHQQILKLQLNGDAHPKKIQSFSLFFYSYGLCSSSYANLNETFLIALSLHLKK